MLRQFILGAVLCSVFSGCKLAEQISAHENRYKSREPSSASKHVGQEAVASLHHQHPRLLMTAEDFDRVKAICHGQDELAGEWYRKLNSRATKLLDDPPVKYSHPLIGASREAFIRIVTLAGMYRLSGDEKFARRAREELLAVAKFPDWNPQDFLATGEMCSAVSIGYDWLFDTLSAEDRATIADAILDKAIDPGLHAFKNKDGWTTNTGNWNFVCNGGLILGALAVGDIEPKSTEQIIALSHDSMRDALKSFAPDGGWDEGPSYWNYATRYLTYALAALETSGVSDAGLAKSPGFSRTGLFRIATQGPTGKLFNFGDCDEHTGACPQMFWMARRFDQPIYAAFEVNQERAEPTMLDLLWYHAGDNASRRESPLHELPRTIRFNNVGVVAMSGDWGSADSTYVAIKAGSNEAHHAHLDIGSFVLDALGERWAIDLGAENYNLPGYSDVDSRRWTFYRAMTAGHNTITIDGQNQSSDGEGTIFYADNYHAILDLSHAYGHKLRATRGVQLDGASVLIQDEVEAADGHQIIWSMHTRAKIAVEGDSATLTQNGKTMRVEIVSPASAHFEVATANPPPPQTQQPDVRKLEIRIPRGKSLTTIAVRFEPQSAPTRERARLIKMVPLSQWKSRTER